MYRYSRNIRHHIETSNFKKHTFSFIFFVLLITSIIFTLLYIQASNRLHRFDTAYHNIIVFEIGQAVSQMNSLSRTGGSNTPNLLGKIRQRIYAIETLQDQYKSTYNIKNEKLIDVSVFQNIYILLDHFDENLLAGRQIKDVQSQLHENVSSLQSLIYDFVETTSN